MATTEGWFGAEWGGVWWGCLLSSRLGSLGSVVSSSSGVRGRAPAKNGFWRILKATESSFLYLYDKNLRGTICTSLPPTPNSGGLVPRVPHIAGVVGSCDRHFDSDDRWADKNYWSRLPTPFTSSREVCSTDQSHVPVKREVDQLLRRWSASPACRWFWNVHCVKEFWDSASSQACSEVRECLAVANILNYLPLGVYSWKIENARLENAGRWKCTVGKRGTKLLDWKRFLPLQFGAAYSCQPRFSFSRFQLPRLVFTWSILL